MGVRVWLRADRTVVDFTPPVGVSAALPVLGLRKTGKFYLQMSKTSRKAEIPALQAFVLTSYPPCLACWARGRKREWGGKTECVMGLRSHVAGQRCDAGAWLVWSPQVDVWEHRTHVWDVRRQAPRWVWYGAWCAGHLCVHSGEPAINGGTLAPGEAGKGLTLCLQIFSDFQVKRLVPLAPLRRLSLKATQPHSPS